MKNKRNSETDYAPENYITEEEIKAISSVLLAVIDKKDVSEKTEKRMLSESMKKLTGGHGIVVTNSKK